MQVKIDMEMPRNCTSCPLTYEGHFGYDFCCITDRIVQKFIYERAEFCLLKECK